MDVRFHSMCIYSFTQALHKHIQARFNLLPGRELVLVLGSILLPFWNTAEGIRRYITAHLAREGTVHCQSDCQQTDAIVSVIEEKRAITATAERGTIVVDILYGFASRSCNSGEVTVWAQYGCGWMDGMIEGNE